MGYVTLDAFSEAMDTEAIVGCVLAAAHPKLRERCSETKIVSVLEGFGAYDADTLRDLLDGHFDAVVAKLEQEAAAPLAITMKLQQNLVRGESTTPTDGASSSAIGGASSSAGAAGSVRRLRCAESERLERGDAVLCPGSQCNSAK